MKTKKECKSEVISQRSEGYINWRDMLKSCPLDEIINFENEAMELYAKELLKETTKLLEKKAHMSFFLAMKEASALNGDDLLNKNAREFVRRSIKNILDDVFSAKNNVC